MMIIGNNNNKLTPLLYPHPCKIYKCLERGGRKRREAEAMERLIYSYSPIPSKVRLKPFSPLSPIPSLPPFDSSRLCFSSFSCTHLKRLNASTPHSSFLCSLAPLLASSSSSSAFQAESPDESVSPPSSLPQIVAGASQQRKVLISMQFVFGFLSLDLGF